jgi:hypothetical protein
MYENLHTTINTLKIIDNHCHPGLAEAFSYFPPEARLAFAVDHYLHPHDSKGEFAYQIERHYEAYEALYGFSRQDLDDPSKQNQLQAAYQSKRENLSGFIDFVMNESGIETVIANFVLPPSLMGKKNVQFTPLIDQLILPFDNRYMRERIMGDALVNTYHHLLEEQKRKYRYVESTYANYLAFIDTALEGYLQEGCCGLKFGIAYARSTYFEKVDPSKGETLYTKAREGDQEAYEQLQDLLMWHTMRKIVELDVPVQFHFAITDNHVRCFDPLNLANMLEDPILKHAKIVILHGGYPNYKNAEVLALGGLATPNNVYIDLSGRIMFANHPKIIAETLRTWLEKPALWNKLLYGSDIIWGERYLHTCARTGRDAIYLALASMIDDKIIDEPLAVTLARKILRENALGLYRFTEGVHLKNA